MTPARSPTTAAVYVARITACPVIVESCHDIVGFPIGAPQTGQTFVRWARLEGGKYFEASDAATLDNAMHAAVKRQFEAVDSKGQVVASGTSVASQ